MQNFRVYFDFPVLWIVPGILLATFLAWLLYQKKGPWPEKLKYLLGGFRAITLILILLLLLGPFVRRMISQTESPSVVFLVDNSLSIKEVLSESEQEELLDQVRGTKEKLDSKFYVHLQSLSEKTVDELKFTHPETNLDQSLREIRNDYEGRNLQAVILLSDGIYNRGMAPTFREHPYPIYTIGVGDTLAKKDLKIQQLNYNKIAYQGNRFPIVVEVAQVGFEGQSSDLILYRDGKRIDQQKIQFKEGQKLQELRFEVEATEAGLQAYTVELSALEGEFTISNNRSDAYIEVIEGKEKILLLAPAPHPDIKAIRSALESNENYELITSIYGFPDQARWDQDDYDLIILHQVPNQQGRFERELIQLSKDGNRTPLWFITGASSQYNSLNRNNSIVEIRQSRSQTDQVRGHLKPEFNLFKLNSELAEVLRKAPPISVPFGNIVLKGPVNEALGQQVGSVSTDRSLFFFAREESRKSAFFLGDGLWKWRIAESQMTGQTQAIDELITKTIQFLSNKEDTKRFRVYSTQDQYLDYEPVVFESEVYNEIYEPVYGTEIKLSIESKNTGEVEQFEFISSEGNTSYRINSLEPGAYTYLAQGRRNDEQYESQGSFSVNRLELESIDLQANFNLLRQLAEQSGGSFFLAEEMEVLVDELQNKDSPGSISTSESIESAINLKWIFFLLLIFLSLEWLGRKYFGGY